MKQQNLNSVETTLELNIAEFLAEYFTGSTSAKNQFSYGLFWDAVTDDSLESIKIMVDYMPKEEGSFYYEYGLLKAEEEMEAEQPVTEKLMNGIDGSIYCYNIRYENPDEKPISFYFYTKTRITAFIQHENEALEVAWEMQEIAQQKPILCLESYSDLFHKALGEIIDAVRNDYYSDEDLQSEYCPDNTEVANWMQYEFACSPEYTRYHYGDNAIGNIIGNAIDAAWTWFRTGCKNNFIRINPVTKELTLNW